MFSSVLYSLLLGALISLQSPVEGAPDGKHPAKSKTETVLTISEEAEAEAAEEQATRDAFELFDVDGNGVIDRRELKSSMASVLKHHVSDNEIENMMESFDTDRSGTIDYAEFREMMRAAANKKPQTADELFDTFDWEKTGFISLEELKNAKLLNSESAKSALEDADLNKDGKLDRDEFKILLWSLDYFPKKKKEGASSSKTVEK